MNRKIHPLIGSRAKTTVSSETLLDNSPIGHFGVSIKSSVGTPFPLSVLQLQKEQKGKRDI